ncbi:MAG: PAS domain-containing protein [Alphaproteobacteria bacterium]|nr:PAS domain-containing protein [Alphaproteobacteria bacterium]
MHAYWRSISPSGRLPGRQHLDPIDIPQLLTNTWLIDLVGEPPRFRIRLMGCAICDYFGSDLTGKWLDEEFDHFEETATSNGLNRIIASPVPDYRRGPPTLNAPKAFLEIERVLLPFATDGKTADMVLCYMLMRAGTDN